jgi:diguanylate cyclase (GGDEF)-like protein
VEEARNVGLLAGVARAFLEKVWEIEEVSARARTDALTGLANRRHFDEQLRRVVAETDRFGGTSSLVLVDIDEFKKVNDTYGHEAGDELLKHVAGVLVGRVRQTDTVARLGGDEFVVLLRGVDPAQARELAREIPELVEGTPVQIGDELLSVSTSVGIALIEPGRHSQSDAVVREADASMYRSKAGRRVRAAARDPEDDRQPSLPADERSSEFEALLLAVEEDLRENSRIRDELRERYGGALPNFVAALLAQMDETAARGLHTLGRLRALARR